MYDRYLLAKSDEELRASIADDEETIKMAGWHDNYTDAARARRRIGLAEAVLKLSVEERQSKIAWMSEMERRLDAELNQPELDGLAF